MDRSDGTSPPPSSSSCIISVLPSDGIATATQELMIRRSRGTKTCFVFGEEGSTRMKPCISKYPPSLLMCSPSLLMVTRAEHCD